MKKQTNSGTHHKNKLLSTTCRKSEKQESVLISEMYSHCLHSKRARWLRWSTGPRPGSSSSCGAAAGRPGPSPAPTPAWPKEHKSLQWRLTDNTTFNSVFLKSWLRYLWLDKVVEAQQWPSDLGGHNQHGEVGVQQQTHPVQDLQTEEFIISQLVK